MTNDKRYNGWTNYETWNVKLWLGNDEGVYNYCRETAQEAWDNTEASKHLTHSEEAATVLANSLKAMHEENMPEVEGVYADLLNAALSEVDWYEIAQAIIEDEEFTEDAEEES